MTNLTENQMAAIAAGLWEPNPHYHSAPDMRDPANLWRALEARPFRLDKWESGRVKVEIYFEPIYSFNGVLDSCIAEGKGDTMADAVFAALVALYKAEHPQE